MKETDEIPTTVNSKLDSYYQEDIKNIKSLKRKLSHLHYIRVLSKFLDERKYAKILDIGCGTGSFLYQCEKRFRDFELHGFEYDGRLINQATKNLKKSMISQGNAEKISHEDAYFDVVTTFQVIEHIYNPEQMIAEIYRILKPGGLLLITTPNLNGLGRLISGDKWSGYRDDHVSLKGCEEWDIAIKKIGFERLSMGSTFFSGIKLFKYVPFSILNNFLLVIFGWAPWKFGESFVGVYVKPQ